MANSDQTTLDNLKNARDAILTQIAAGRTVIEITTNNRTERSADPGRLLESIEELIAVYTRKVTNAAHSPMRVGKLRRPSS